MRLKGKVAIVTGGNSGIGRATAMLMAREGARVVIAARNAQRGAEVVREIEARGGQVRFVRCDVRLAADCQRVVEQTLQAYDRLDILFNNAGIIFPGRTVVDTAEEEWDATLDANVKGMYLMCRYAIPPMAQQRDGVIINTASDKGLVGGRGAAAYCASKGAVVLLTKAMALDHAPQNIRVNCICPGSVDTPMLSGEMEARGGVDEARPAFAAKHPLNRIAQPEEVAAAVVFLASPEASFITGVALSIDGGRTAGELDASLWSREAPAAAGGIVPPA